MIRLALAAALLIAQPSPTRILFIGNSLTYSNDLPALVCAIARSAGGTSTCESIARPDYGLEEHWNERRGAGGHRARLGGGDLKQGPSALPESSKLLIDFTRRFDAEIKKTGARTALFMVWPRAPGARFSGRQPLVHRRGERRKGLLLPAGEAWRAAWATDPALPLYSPGRLPSFARGARICPRW